MKPVVAELALNIQHDNETGGNANSQAKYVYERKQPVPLKVSPGGFEIVFEHKE
jgi:hypothetical protein